MSPKAQPSHVCATAMAINGNDVKMEHHGKSPVIYENVWY